MQVLSQVDTLLDRKTENGAGSQVYSKIAKGKGHITEILRRVAADDFSVAQPRTFGSYPKA